MRGYKPLQPCITRYFKKSTLGSITTLVREHIGKNKYTANDFLIFALELHHEITNEEWVDEIFILLDHNLANAKNLGEFTEDKLNRAKNHLIAYEEDKQKRKKFVVKEFKRWDGGEPATKRSRSDV